MTATEGPAPKGRPESIAVGCDDIPKHTRFVVAFESPADPCRKALHRPVAEIVVPSATDVGRLVETLLDQGAVRIRIHEEAVR